MKPAADPLTPVAGRLPAFADAAHRLRPCWHGPARRAARQRPGFATVAGPDPDQSLT